MYVINPRFIFAESFNKEEYWTIEAVFPEFSAELFNYNHKDFKINNEIKINENFLVTISTIISLVVFVVRVLLLKEVTVFTTIATVLSKVLSVAVIWIVAIAKPKDVKSENLIYTVLPIIAICDSIVYSIVDSLII